MRELYDCLNYNNGLYVMQINYGVQAKSVTQENFIHSAERNESGQQSQCEMSNG